MSMGCHCGGQCGTCRKMAGGLTGNRDHPPANFPSLLQANMAAPGVDNRDVPRPPVNVGTARHVPSTTGQGTASGEIGTAPWQVPAPNWGSRGRLRWGHFIKNALRQPIDYLPFRGEMAGLDSTPRVRRRNHPPLDERRYNLRAITDQQVMALAAARAKARQKAGG